MKGQSRYLRRGRDCRLTAHWGRSSQVTEYWQLEMAIKNASGASTIFQAKAMMNFTVAMRKAEFVSQLMMAIKSSVDGEMKCRRVGTRDLAFASPSKGSCVTVKAAVSRNTSTRLKAGTVTSNATLIRRVCGSTLRKPSEKRLLCLFCDGKSPHWKSLSSTALVTRSSVSVLA
jgi:hypothetical protein